MKFRFVYNKKNDTWDLVVETVKLTLTRADMKKLAWEADIELLDTDPQWQKHLKDALWKEENE